MRKSASLKSAQMYDKAVGYAEGYSAGLDQAKQVLSSGGLDLGAHDLHSYDLSGIALPTPPQAAHIVAVLPASRGVSARLPPLPPSVDLSSQQPQQQIMASVAHMSMEELRHQVLRLHGAHAASHRTCAGLREECLRLQTLLDHQALASAPTSSSSSRHAAASPSRHTSAHYSSLGLPLAGGGAGGWPPTLGTGGSPRNALWPTSAGMMSGMMNGILSGSPRTGGGGFLPTHPHSHTQTLHSRASPSAGSGWGVVGGVRGAGGGGGDARTWGGQGWWWWRIRTGFFAPYTLFLAAPSNRKTRVRVCVCVCVCVCVSRISTAHT